MPRLALAQTHHADCWKKPHHHECALTRIEQLEYQYKLLAQEAQAQKAPYMSFSAPETLAEVPRPEHPELSLSSDEQNEHMFETRHNPGSLRPICIDTEHHPAGIFVYAGREIAERIVACWNACAGMETNALYDGQLADRCADTTRFWAANEALRTQLDELTSRFNEYLPDGEYIVTEQGLWLEPLGGDASVRVLFDDDLHIHVYRKGEEDGDEVDTATLNLP